MNESLGKGSISRNNYKYDYNPETGKYTFKEGSNPKGPDYAGSVTLALQNGQIKLRLTGWVRRAQDGKPPFLSIALEYPRDEQRRIDLVVSKSQANSCNPPQEEEANAFDEALPF